MAKVSVMREVTELTGTELLDAYDAGGDTKALRAELLRRLDPPPKVRQPPAVLGSLIAKGTK
jgi:hypothetical protein